MLLLRCLSPSLWSCRDPGDFEWDALGTPVPPGDSPKPGSSVDDLGLCGLLDGELGFFNSPDLPTLEGPLMTQGVPLQASHMAIPPCAELVAGTAPTLDSPPLTPRRVPAMYADAFTFFGAPGNPPSRNSVVC